MKYQGVDFLIAENIGKGVALYNDKFIDIKVYQDGHHRVFEVNNQAIDNLGSLARHIKETYG